MSQAEELLDSLVEAYAAEYDNNSDPHIVIGADRVIVVPEELKRIAVQYDHNMRTVTFDCPRYYDGRDMSKMRVYITIEGPLGARSSYIADNVRVDDKKSSVMHFDWTIKRTITSVDGPITFLVCIRKADNEGNEENHWNSELNSEMYISKGMEYDSETVESEHPDIVSQLLDRMDIVETNASAEAMQGYADKWLNNNVDSVLNDIQVKGAETLESIPEDYMTTYKYASEGARSKADAIIRTVEGNTITVADSSDDYVRGLRVFGKTTQITTTGVNLLDPTSTASFLNNQGNSKTGICIPIVTDGTYSYYIEDSVTVYIGYTSSLTSAATHFASTLVSKPSSGTVSLKAGQYFLLWFDTGVVYNASRYFLALGTDVSFEPYTGGKASPSPDYPQELVSVENPVAELHGKNLINLTTSGTTVGVTETIVDGKVSFSGTANSSGGRTAWARSNIITLYPGEYSLSMHVPSGKAPTPCLTRHGDSLVVAPGPTTITVTETVKVYLGFNYNEGITYDAKNVSVQLELGGVATEHVSYTASQSIAVNRMLSGIPVASGGNYTDTTGQQWVCDEVNFERGVYVQRIDIATLANSYTEYSVLSATGRGQLIIAPTPAKNQYLYGTICNMAIRNSDALSAVHGEYYENPANIVLVGNVGDTEVAMREKFADVKYLYALATPIEIPLTAEELNSFAALRTNYPNTTVLNDSGVKMELKYNADTQLYIDNKIAAAVAALINNN